MDRLTKKLKTINEKIEQCYETYKKLNQGSLTFYQYLTLIKGDY